MSATMIYTLSKQKVIAALALISAQYVDASLTIKFPGSSSQLLASQQVRYDKDTQNREDLRQISFPAYPDSLDATIVPVSQEDACRTVSAPTFPVSTAPVNRNWIGFTRRGGECDETIKMMKMKASGASAVIFGTDDVSTIIQLKYANRTELLPGISLNAERTNYLSQVLLDSPELSVQASGERTFPVLINEYWYPHGGDAVRKLESVTCHGSGFIELEYVGPEESVNIHNYGITADVAMFDEDGVPMLPTNFVYYVKNRVIHSGKPLVICASEFPFKTYPNSHIILQDRNEEEVSHLTPLATTGQEMSNGRLRRSSSLSVVQITMSKPTPGFPNIAGICQSTFQYNNKDPKDVGHSRSSPAYKSAVSQVLMLEFYGLRENVHIDKIYSSNDGRVVETERYRSSMATQYTGSTEDRQIVGKERVTYWRITGSSTGNLYFEGFTDPSATQLDIYNCMSRDDYDRNMKINYGITNTSKNENTGNGSDDTEKPPSEKEPTVSSANGLTPSFMAIASVIFVLHICQVE